MFASLATLILFCSLGSGGNVRGNNTVQKALSRDEVKALKVSSGAHVVWASAHPYMMSTCDKV